MNMPEWLRTLKPAAPARVHLLLAALMWTVVGGAMVFFGIRWVLVGWGARSWPLIVLAVGIGLAKSHFVLDRAARRVVARIKERGDGRCIGGFLSIRTWLFVLLMMTCGRLLRGGLIPHPIVGLVYAAVGTALLLSTRCLWSAWQQHHATT
jgi:hypothetical protein